MADKREESTSVEILEFWMKFAIRNPTQHDRVAKEVAQLLKNVRACDTSDTLQPAVDPVMRQLLFESVTQSSTVCVEYCVQIWFERIESQEKPQHLNFSDLPNPLEFLDPQSPTRKSTFPSSPLQLKFLDSQERQAHIKYFRLLFYCLPAKFYSRTSVAFFMFLEFYKRNVCENDSELLDELMLWIETCILLITEGLMKASGKSVSLSSVTVQKRLPLQHTLSVLLVSTEALKFLKNHSEIQNKLAKALERLQSCSSGVTRKWLQVLRSGIESDDRFGQV